MKTTRTFLAVWLLLVTCAFSATGKPVKVFILAGQFNMDGQADIRTIDFLGEDKDAARAALLKTFKPDGKTFVTRDDVWVASGSIYEKLQTGLGTTANSARALGRNTPSVTTWARRSTNRCC